MDSRSSLFAAVRVRGPAWEAGRSMREQRSWPEHADFMNALATGRFVVLGGPLGDGQRVLLIVEARSADEVHERLDRDPWTVLDLLRTESVQPWRILLDRDAAEQPRAD
jgi:uncharacterized protein YciI